MPLVPLRPGGTRERKAKWRTPRPDGHNTSPIARRVESRPPRICAACSHGRNRELIDILNSFSGTPRPPGEPHQAGPLGRNEVRPLMLPRPLLLRTRSPSGTLRPAHLLSAAHPGPPQNASERPIRHRWVPAGGLGARGTGGTMMPTRRGRAWSGRAWLDKAGRGVAWRGWARRGKAWWGHGGGESQR